MRLKWFPGDVATWQLVKSRGLTAPQGRELPRGNFAASE